MATHHFFASDMGREHNCVVDQKGKEQLV